MLIPIRYPRSHKRTAAIACLMLSLVGPERLFAQTRVESRLTLTQAMDAARSFSADLTAARHGVAAAEARTRQAGVRPNPTVSYGHEQTAANSQDIVALEQRFEIGALRASRIAAASARHDASIARLDAVRNQVDFETVRAYALASAARQKLRLVEQEANAFARAVRVSDQRLAAGDVSGFSHRRLQLEAARYTTIRAEAQLASRNAMVALATLVSGTTDGILRTPYELADSLPSLEAWPAADQGRWGTLLALQVDSLVNLALRSRGDLRAVEFDAIAMRAEARVAAATRFPSPSFSLGYKSERSPGMTGSASGFVAGVAIPLALWDRRHGALAAATSDADRALAEAESLRRRVARDVAQAFDAWRSLEEPLATLQPQLGDAASRAMRAVQVAYEEGETTLLEWLDAVRAYLETESSFIALRSEVVIRRAALIRAIGENSPAADATQMRQ